MLSILINYFLFIFGCLVDYPKLRFRGNMTLSRPKIIHRVYPSAEIQDNTRNTDEDISCKRIFNYMYIYMSMSMSKITLKENQTNIRPRILKKRLK